MEIKHKSLPGTGVIKIINNSNDPTSFYIEYGIKEVENLKVIITIDYDYNDIVKKKINNFTLCFHDILYNIYNRRVLPLDENAYILHVDYMDLSVSLYNQLSLKIKDIYNRSSKEHFKLVKMFERAFPLLQSKGYKIKLYTRYIEVDYKGIKFRVDRNVYALLLPCPDRLTKTLLKRNQKLFKLTEDKLHICKKFVECVVNYLKKVIGPYDRMLNLLIDAIEEK